MKTHYQILQVANDASPSIVKAAYYHLQREYHPDRNPGNQMAAEMSRQVNEAYQVVGDAAKRLVYDAQLRAARPQAAPFPGANAQPFAFDPMAFVNSYPPSAYGPIVDAAVKSATAAAVHAAGTAFTESILDQLPLPLREFALRTMATAQQARKKSA